MSTSKPILVNLPPLGPPLISVDPLRQSHPTPWGLETSMTPAQGVMVLTDLSIHPPADWIDWSNLASALYLKQDDYAALDAARTAVSMKRVTPTLLNLAIILEMLGRLDEAFPYAEEAHMLDPEDSLAGGLYADALIRMGEWRKGWPLHTRYHHGLEQLRQYLPEWNGVDSLRRKRVFVLEGGGFGDNIIFLRWLPRLKQLGARRVTYGAPASLIPLLREQSGMLGADDFLPSVWETIRRDGFCKLPVRDYDCFVSVLALPGLCGATVEDLRSPVGYPYFHANSEKSRLRRMVLGHSPIPRVGICWQAGEHAYPRKYKTLSSEQLDTLLSSASPRGIEWVSLQYDALPPVPMLRPAIRDWSDTAAIIDNLDLVVTVDTGVAHLAGAMGKPTWLLLPGRASWPFLLRRDDSPLYPSMRIFRNHVRGLDLAVAAVSDALKNGEIPRRNIQ